MPYLESLKQSVYILTNLGVCSIVLMDLSKVYDCVPHDLLLAKMEGYGLSIDSLKPMHSYLIGRSHRVKIGTSFNQVFHRGLF